MNLIKAKPHFWSQLLLSMIAIFALPTVQANDYRLSSQGLLSSNLSQVQQIQQQILVAVALKKQQCTLPISKPKLKNFAIFTPQFLTLWLKPFFAKHAPIRAGPAF